KEKASNVEDIGTIEVGEPEIITEDEEVEIADTTEDETIVPDVFYEEWECVIPRGDTTVILTLELYPLESKFYEIQSPYRPDDYILFGNEIWEYYDLRNDTMYLRFDDGSFRYDWHCCKFFITMHSETIMEMEYIGALPGVPVKRNYLFNRKN
ncbi:MAG: hypothetical protein LBQ22_07585, partial [Bacteroidales bacterium]|nr:hypothetical protein [Bacteroidales bacterium]